LAIGSQWREQVHDRVQQTTRDGAKPQYSGVTVVTDSRPMQAYPFPHQKGIRTMTSNTYQLSQTADRITSAIALLVAAVIAAPIVLLAIAPFIS
jgi:hypothetical protein